MSQIAMLLVGGKGTRLRELGQNKPKCLINVAGKTILEHQLDMLMLNGFDEIVLCTGHMGDQVAQALKELPYPYRMLKIGIVQEDKPAGTAGALREAWKQTVGDKQSWIALNGDVFCPELRIPGPQFETVQIAISEYEEPFGRVVNSPGTRIVKEFKEKQKYMFSAGVYVFGAAPVKYGWIKDEEISIEKETWPRLAASGHLRTWTYAGPWFDLGTPERIADCEAWLSGKRK
jgi:mannose-1-phosphate guanylyltransferase